MGKFDQGKIHSFAIQDYSYEKRHILTSSRTNQEAIPQILYYWAINKCGFCAFMFLPNFLHTLLAEEKMKQGLKTTNRCVPLRD